jgi:putative sigma-54 modulation protein
MDVKINAHHIVVSAAMEKFIHEKLSKLQRYLPNIVAAVVDITQQKATRGPDQITVQITVRHSRGAILRAEERVSVQENPFVDTQAAVNLATDKMYRRISRFKGKRKDRRERAGRYIATLEELDLAEEMPEDDELEAAPDAEQLEQRIYRRKAVSVTPMTEDEAIEQMELLGHTFFVFHHAERNRVNVLYKRSNGGYGVIDPILE